MFLTSQLMDDGQDSDESWAIYPNRKDAQLPTPTHPETAKRPTTDPHHLLIPDMHASDR